jgi:transposase
VHGLDQNGQPVLRKQVRRGQVLKFFATVSPCVVGMEACPWRIPNHAAIGV